MSSNRYRPQAESRESPWKAIIHMQEVLEDDLRAGQAETYSRYQRRDAGAVLASSGSSAASEAIAASISMR
jgi:hypothetical protein